MEIEIDYQKDYYTMLTKHQKCIDIMMAIMDMERRIRLNEETITQLNGNFPSIKEKYERKIDTQKQAIKRLLERYNKYNSL